jgi:subtilisin family serine protease
MTNFHSNITKAMALLAFIFFYSCSSDDMSSFDDMANDHPVVKYETGAVIPGQYMVIFSESADASIKMKASATPAERIQAVEEFSGELLASLDMGKVDVVNYYSTAVKGFTAKLSNDQFQALKNNNNVAIVEQDRIVTLNNGKGGGNGGGGKGNNKDNKDSGSGTDETNTNTTQPITTTQPAQTIPLGVNRVGRGNGTGKTVWVIDTGVELNHPDLNVDKNRSASFVGGTANDGHGHGTHVAGIIAAIDNGIGVVGVAANATIVAVKVIADNGSGSISSIVNGIDYVANNAAFGDVVNISLGGSASSTLDNAVINLASKGVKISIAAGNNGAHASNTSPARVVANGVYTISAMDHSDNWAVFSNFGNPPINYCQPGAGIYSTYLGGTYAYMSGTSMAAPHFAGLLLLGGYTTNGTVKNDPDGNPDPIAVKR